MSRAAEMEFLKSDLESLTALLAKLPESRVLERIGFEARRDEVTAELAALEKQPGALQLPAPKATPLEPRLAAAPLELEQSLAEVQAHLANLPATRVLERAGLEARRDALLVELSARSQPGSSVRARRVRELLLDLVAFLAVLAMIVLAVVDKSLLSSPGGRFIVGLIVTVLCVDVLRSYLKWRRHRSALLELGRFDPSRVAVHRLNSDSKETDPLEVER